MGYQSSSERNTATHTIARAIASMTQLFAYRDGERDPDGALEWNAHLDANAEDGLQVTVRVYVNRDDRIEVQPSFSFPGDPKAEQAARAHLGYGGMAPESPSFTVALDRTKAAAATLEKRFAEFEAYTRYLHEKALAHVAYENRKNAAVNRLIAIFEPFRAHKAYGCDGNTVYWTGGEASSYGEGCTIKLHSVSLEEAEAIASALTTLRSAAQLKSA